MALQMLNVSAIRVPELPQIMNVSIVSRRGPPPQTQMPSDADPSPRNWETRKLTIFLCDWGAQVMELIFSLCGRWLVQEVELGDKETYHFLM